MDLGQGIHWRCLHDVTTFCGVGNLSVQDAGLNSVNSIISLHLSLFFENLEPIRDEQCTRFHYKSRIMDGIHT